MSLFRWLLGGIQVSQITGTQRTQSLVSYGADTQAFASSGVATQSLVTWQVY